MARDDFTGHIHRDDPRQQRWTPAEKLRLRTMWRTASTAELLAAFPGRSAETIAQRARHFNLTAKDRPTGAAPMFKH